MNKLIHTLIMLTLLVSTASAANWIFDPVPGTITDGEWTFAATVNGTSLAVGACSADPGAVATLDFTKGVTSPDETTTYTITTLNPQFSTYGNKTRVGELRLPASGLANISANAFNGCTALTNVVNFLPDSVTILGEAAFQSVPAQQSLVLRGVVSVPLYCFKLSSVTQVTFGSALKTLNGNYGRGCFDSCQKLTTVNFDPGMTGGTISGEGVFAYCSKLTGTVDLSGFTNLGGNRPFYYYGGSINKIILSSSLTAIAESFLHSASSVKTIEFTAGPPSITGTSLYKIYNYTVNTSLSDLYTIVPETYKNDWAAYCENDTINDLNSYWDPAWVPAAKSKNLFLVYKSVGGVGGELGDWVYDGTCIESTRQGWKFGGALNGAKALTVGDCVAHPSMVSDLDFSTSVTDTNGNGLAIVNVSPAFAYADGRDRVDYIKPKPGAGYVGKVVLPESGLVTIGKCAFGLCTNLTEVTPALPDSVTSVGAYAFQGVPFAAGKRDIRLYGISTIEYGVFYQAPVTSVAFGPRLKKLSCKWMNSAFLDCVALTNIVFDPAMSGGYCEGTTYGPFEGCNNVRKLDLSGFSSLAYHLDNGSSIGRFGTMNGVGEIMLGTNLTALGKSIFNNMPGLTNVTFKGVPPTLLETPYISGQSATKKVTTYIHSTKKSLANSEGKRWLDYAVNADIRAKGTTWAADYVTAEIDLSLRPLLTIEPDIGTVVVLR